MNKQPLLYGLIFLVLASLGQETVAMKVSTKKTALVLGFTSLIGLAIKLKMRPNKGEVTLNETTHKDLLHSIYETYPELKKRSIIIVNAPHQSYATEWRITYDCIFVPFDDQLWKELKNYPREFLKIKGSLMHEASHILRHDNKQSGIPFLVSLFCLSKKIKTSLSLNATTILLHQFVLMPWQEYRADQDVIKRAKNPEMLRAKSRYFANLGSQDTNAMTLTEKIKHFCDPHPAHKTRATYFAEAAEKLEAQKAAPKD